MPPPPPPPHPNIIGPSKHLKVQWNNVNVMLDISWNSKPKKKKEKK